MKEYQYESYKNIVGASYIGKPSNNTVMYVSKKVEKLVKELNNVSGCLVFAEKGVLVDECVSSKNEIIYTDNPQRDYAVFVSQMNETECDLNSNRSFTLTQMGYYVGENVKIGENSYIEPDCLIGHNVVIGNNVTILAGSIIKNSIIGCNCIINEKAIIGSQSFTMATDKAGNKFRIPSVGKVFIGDYVEIGAEDNIAIGETGDTIIDDYAKIDALVHVGHDVHIHKNVEIPAGVIIGGFTEIGENCFVGINTSIKNRIVIGSNSIIGMGSNVIYDVEENSVMAGNPARKLRNNNII